MLDVCFLIVCMLCSHKFRWTLTFAGLVDFAFSSFVPPQLTLTLFLELLVPESRPQEMSPQGARLLLVTLRSEIVYSDLVSHWNTRETIYILGAFRLGTTCMVFEHFGLENRKIIDSPPIKINSSHNFQAFRCKFILFSWKFSYLIMHMSIFCGLSVPVCRWAWVCCCPKTSSACAILL